MGSFSQLEMLSRAGPALLLQAGGTKGREMVSGSPGAVRVSVGETRDSLQEGT